MRYVSLIWISVYLAFGAGTPPVPPSINATPKILLSQGWNLVSPPSNLPLNTNSIPNVVSNGAYYYDTKQESWKKAVNIDIAPGVGFWVNVSQRSYIAYKQTFNDSFSINDFSVSKGLNLLGMSLDSERINIITSNHDGKAIYTYDARAATWTEHKSYSRDSLKAGTGFWLLTN